MNTTILLVRHAESEGNVSGVFTGQLPLPLSQMGHKQAELTADHIYKNFCVDAVYSSDLPRAVQTAEHIAARYGLPVKTDKRLRELYAGLWENKHFPDLPTLYPEDFAVWKNDTIHARCTGGESVLEMGERSFAGIWDIAQNHVGQTVVIVSHATPIRMTLWRLSGQPEEAFQTLNFGCNCAISTLSYDGTQLRTVCANYTEHLQSCKTKLPSNI